VFVDKSFEDGGELLLLATGKLRSSLEQAAHLAGWTQMIIFHSRGRRPAFGFVLKDHTSSSAKDPQGAMLHGLKKH